MSIVVRAHAQVVPQTGSATFTLPIFNWKDDKSRLNGIVGLDYNSGSGLKVNSIASNLGQGWELVGGGMVTRLQVGEPDDQPGNEGNGTIEDINKYPPGYLYNSANAAQGCPNAMVYFPIFGDQNHLYKQHNSIAADREQDYFAAQFNGRSVMFVLGKNNGDQGIALGNSRIKIWFQRDQGAATGQHIRTTISAFFIQDENGLIYTFNKLSTTKIMRMHPSFPDPDMRIAYPNDLSENQIKYEKPFDDIPLSYNPYVVTGWYLTGIRDPLTNRTLTFNYDIRNIDNSAGDDITRYWNTSFAFSESQSSSTDYLIISHKRSVTATPFINSIQYPDGYTVIFNYDTNNPRADLNGDFPMKSIDIKYFNRYVSSVLLNTTYFILNGYGYPQNAAQFRQARLCLRSITKLGPDLKESQSPYLFDYYTGSNNTEDFVPPPFYYTKDIWGFYNGSAVNSLLPSGPQVPLLTDQLTSDISSVLYSTMNIKQLSALAFYGYNPLGGVVYNYNTIKAGFAKNGLLKAITYPAGGTVTYEYQQNAYNTMVNQSTVTLSNTHRENPTPFVGGVHVSKVIRTDGGYSNDNNHQIITDYNYVDASGTATSQWGYEEPSNSTLGNYYLQLDGAHHPIVGACSYDYKFPGLLSKEEAQSVVDDNASIRLLLNVLSYTIMVNSWVGDVVTLIATGNPVFIIYDVLTAIVEYFLTTCDLQPQQGSTVAYVNHNIFGGNTYPILFSRLEMVPEGGPPGIGKTVLEFTDFRDYPLWDGRKTEPDVLLGAYPNFFSMKQRAAAWAYGLPKKTTVYDATGNKVSETENVYDFSNAQMIAGVDQSCNCYVDVQSLRDDVWRNYSNQQALTYATSKVQNNGGTGTLSELDPQVYQIYTGRSVLRDSYERVFKQGTSSQYVETATHYDYDPGNFLVNKVTTTRSNGDKSYDEIYYSSDYTSPSVLNTMNANNIVNDVVATYSSVLKAGASGNPVYLGAKVNDYGSLQDGEIKAFRTLVGRSAQPVQGFAFSSSNPFNYPNLTPKQIFIYDNQGAGIGTEDEGGRWVTNIYDYNSKFIIGTAVNANPILDKPCYSSFETEQLGGWGLTGQASYVSTNVVTGRRSLALSSGNRLSASLNSAKPYILSFWANNNHISVGSGATLVKSAPVINGTTYYEYKVPQGASSVSLNTSDNTIIDELRLYPSMSRMRTTSYDSLLGKISECDENNRAVYYEYDNLGRLRYVMDENHNLVKMFEYNSRTNSHDVFPSAPGGHAVYLRFAQEFTHDDTNGNTVTNLVAYFYADAAYTQSLFVNNITIGVTVSPSCSDGPPTSPSTYYVTGSGTNLDLGKNSFLVQQLSMDDANGTQVLYNCNYTYTLTQGSMLLN